MLLNEPGFSLASLTSSLYCGCTGGGGGWWCAAGCGGGSSARSTITLGRPSFPRFVLRCVTTSIAAPTSHYKLCCGCSSLFFYLDSSLDASRGVGRRCRKRRRYGGGVSLAEPAVIVADANGELLVPRKNWTHAPNLTTFVECWVNTNIKATTNNYRYVFFEYLISKKFNLDFIDLKDHWHSKYSFQWSHRSVTYEERV